jgi:hypothetical protein
MSVQESAKNTLLPKLVKWLILGIFILTFRFFRWGGVLGMIGIAAFAGAIWFAFRLADPDTGELTGTEGTAIFALLIAGVMMYVAGVVLRRRRVRAEPIAAQVDPNGGAVQSTEQP